LTLFGHSFETEEEEKEEEEITKGKFDDQSTKFNYSPT